MSSAQKKRETNVTTFLLRDRVFTSPNAEPLSVIPPVESFSGDDPDPNKTFALNWAVGRYLSLPFVISPPLWDHPLLQRLKYDQYSVPIERKFGYKLQPSLIESWANLEETLYYVAKSIVSDAGILFPLDSGFFPLPRTYGYAREHKNEHVARKCAIRSRDAFAPLMAMCSFGLAFFHRRTLPPDEEPLWVKTLLSEGRVHPDWLHLFRNSPIADFSLSRAGVIYDAATCPNPHDVRAIVSAGVNVWICWGSYFKPLKRSPIIQLQPYFPDPDQMAVIVKERTLRELAGPGATNALITASSASESAAPANDYPIPEEFSRQSRGQTWQEFFKALEIQHQRMLKTESDRDRQARLSREANAKRFEAPGKGSTTKVYRWTKVNDFYMRARVTKAQMEDEWAGTAVEHMRFNSFDNEWDLCSAFDPEAGSRDSFDDTDGPDYPEPFESGEIPYEPPLPFPEQPPSMEAFRRDILSIFGPGNSHTTGGAPQFIGTLDQQLYRRFGFDCEPGVTSSYPLPLPDEWDRVLFTLQDSMSQVDEPYRGAISHFVTELINANGDTLRRIKLLWDLSASNPSPLSDRIGHYFTVERRDLATIWKGGMVSQPQTTSVYILRPGASVQANHDWLLTIASPSCVLQCLRSCTSNLVAVARFCIQSGIAFNTWTSIASPEISAGSSLPHPRIGLGIRPRGYSPGAADYAAYEDARDRLLSSSSGRAALLKGGIVWRLAMEFVNPSRVLIGPSDVAASQGHVIKLSDDGYLCDDHLSDDASDLISGVYRVQTGESVDLSVHIIKYLQSCRSELWTGLSFFVVAEAVDLGKMPLQRRLLDSQSGTMVPGSSWRNTC